MKKTLKIAIYSGEIPSTTFIERLIKGLSKSGTDVVLFGVLQGKVNYCSNVKVVAYKQTRFSKIWHLIRFTILLLLFKPKAKKRLDVYLREKQLTDLYSKVKYYPILWYQPDVFHIQWAKGLDDWIWVKEFGIKLVLSLRGAHINYSPIADLKLANMYRSNFHKVDAFHAVSEAIGKEAQRYGAPSKKIEVIYSGLPNEEHKDKYVTTTYQNHNLFHIISVGRPHWKKGYVYALDACKLLKDKGFKFHYTIVGGQNSIELIYQIHDLKLKKEVTLLGALPFDDVQRQIKNANLLLLPSVEEGIANVVLEAMKNKTLVLTTDCGGMDEVIKDGENGFIVPIRDPQTITSKIIEISMLSEEKEHTLLNNAQDTITAQFSAQKMVKEMRKLYQST